MTDAVTVITTKRDGHRLSDDDIGWLFEAYAKGEVADEQMSALLMAIYFQGLDGAELRTWTAAMIASGDRLDLSPIKKPTVDKHSTGGVGDKVSLVLAPLVAACGAAVPSGQVSTIATGQGVDLRHARYRRTAALADR